MSAHKWVNVNLGHSNVMCEYCKGTPREIEVIGDINVCDRAPDLEAELDQAKTRVAELEALALARLRGWSAAKNQVAGFEAILESCRHQFQFYVEQHKAKGTPDGAEKARVNRLFVDLIDAALNPP